MHRGRPTSLATKRVRAASCGRRNDSGQALVIFAFLLSGLGAALIIALVMNLGWWYGTDANLQKAADLSALAGAQYLATGGGIASASGDPCSEASDASSCAIEVATNNGVTAGVGNVTKVTATVSSDDSSITVTAMERDAGLFFSSTRVESATASVRPLNGASGYFPAAFSCPPYLAEGCTSDDFPAPGTPVSYTFGTSPAPGSFNLLSSCGAGDAPAVAQCIYCTTTYSLPDFTRNPLSDNCDGGTTTPQQCVGQSAQGAPGAEFNSDPVNTAMTWLASQNAVILLPIYTSVTGRGNNTNYFIAGFASLLVTRWNNPKLSGIFEGYLSDATIEGNCTGSGPDFESEVFHLTA